MSSSRIERRIIEASERIKRLRDELAVLDEQLVQFANEADDARTRALVSDSPMDGREARDAQRHLDAMSRSREDMRASIAQLERTRDDLLEQLVV